ELRPLMYRGAPVEDGRTVPDGTTALYMVADRGNPTVVPLVKQEGAWKVDVRWWIAAQQMTMSSIAPAPEHLVIRALLAAMLSLDRQAAAELLTDARGIDLLFAGAPRSR